MALPLLLIFNAGRIISIVVRAGTALARFVAKNPKIVGSTLSIEAISSAIQSYNTTENEKYWKNHFIIIIYIIYYIILYYYIIMLYAF